MTGDELNSKDPAVSRVVILTETSASPVSTSEYPKSEVAIVSVVSSVAVSVLSAAVGTSFTGVTLIVIVLAGVLSSAPSFTVNRNVVSGLVSASPTGTYFRLPASRSIFEMTWFRPPKCWATSHHSVDVLVLPRTVRSISSFKAW